MASTRSLATKLAPLTRLAVFRRSALNTTGGVNTANGYQALFSNKSGTANTASGNVALCSNTTGGFNTANGANALFNNTTGSSNIAVGLGAGGALTTGSNNIDIGNAGVAAEANTIRIGKQGTQTATFIAGITGKTASGGVAVYVNANGKLGTTVSSAHFKEAIKPMDKASEAIHALKPVTFRYKQELDPESIPQFGLVAEEVEKVNPALVARDAQGEVYTVRYEAVNAMLLNEFLKEHRKVAQLETTVAQQQKRFESKIADQQKEIEALTTSLQKVSDQLELSKPAPRMVLNDQ
jgi:Chaperone of endosialidase